HPYALSMNSAILKRIATHEQGFNYDTPDEVPRRLWDFVREYAPESIKDWRASLWMTGKNVGSFDLQFLKRLETWSQFVDVRHRFIDPGTLYFDPRADRAVPSMDECAKRAGLLETTKHDAIGDARIVIELLRR